MDETVTITKEHLALAMRTIWQGDEKIFGVKGFTGELWDELINLFGDQPRVAPYATLPDDGSGQ
jgi:hypothetical protein